MRINKMVKSLFFFILIFSSVPAAYAVRGLDGSFLAIDNNNASWSLGRWGQELASMRAINMNTVIPWCSVYSTNAFYTGCSLPGVTVKGTPLQNILTIADTTGMSVILGLWADDYWWNYEKDTAYLASICNKSKTICDELWSQVSTHSSFKGWYFWQEIDNVNQVNELDRVNLVTYFLRPLTDYCKTKTPNKWISIAPFFNDTLQQPPEYEIWWKKTLTEVPSLNLLIPQDGIGVQHATFTTVSTYFQALKNACDSTKRTLWSDLELFDREDNPALISRITTQIAIENQYVSGFSSWDYLYSLSPNTGPAHAQLYAEYQAYLTGKVIPPKVNFALNKPYTISPPASTTYQDNRTKLTDGQYPNGLNSQVGWLNPALFPSITLDLGTVRSNIIEVRGYCLRDTTSVVFAPQYLIVSTSNDGTSYSYVGNATARRPRDGRANVYRWVGLGFSGRYIKLVIVPRGTEWTMITEIAVY
jgi:hypothetical protein